MLKIRELTALGSHCQVLDNISFEVETGKLTAVIGPSLSGKELLAEVVAGQRAPSSGDVVINHYRLTSNDLRAKAQLGYLPPEPAFEPYLTGFEYLDMLGAIYQIGPEKRRGLIKDLISSLKLEEDAYTLVERLHGSAKQKLSIAASYLHQPKCIVLVEPLRQLDWSDSERVITLIKRSIPTSATLLITDDLGLVQSLADEVVILDQGKIITQGTIKQIVNHLKPAHADIDSAYRKLFSVS